MVEKYLKEEEKLEENTSQPNLSFPKILRLKKPFEFKSLLKSEKRLIGQYVIINYRINKNISNPKLGITIPSRLGKAHLRNKFKRRTKEIFRKNQYNILNNLEINILPKIISKNLKYSELENDILSLIKSIKK